MQILFAMIGLAFTNIDFSASWFMYSGKVLAVAIWKHERNGLDSTQVIRNYFKYRTRYSFVQQQFNEQIGTQAIVPHKIE